MKKWLLLLLPVVFLLAACEAAVTPTPRSNQDDLETVRIGVNLEFSGEGAAYGSAMLEGIDMAVAEANAKGGLLGKQIETVVYDNKTDETETASVATKLSTEDGVSGIIGPATSGAARAQSPILEQYQTPVVLPAATNDNITLDIFGNVLNQVFRVCFQDSFQGVALARYADEQAYQKAVVIKDNSTDYGQLLSTAFIDTFIENGGEVVAEESYISGDTDFQAIITNIRRKDFDVIFIPGYYTEAGSLIKQIRQAGIKQPILGPDGFGDATLVELAGAENVSDVYYSAHFSSLTEDPLVQDFLARYKEEYGGSASMFTALAYDATNLLIAAIEEADTANPAEISPYLADTKDFAGVTGTFSMDDKHNPIKDAFVVELQDGKEVGAEIVSAEE